MRQKENRHKRLGTKKISGIGLMIALAFVLSYIALVRIILAGFTFGSLASLMYSFAGGMLSFFVMFILKKADIFSVNGVSVAGGVSHNTGQIIVAMLVLKTKLLIYYLPALIISGTVAGVVVGIAGGLLIKRIGFVIHSQT